MALTMINLFILDQKVCVRESTDGQLLSLPLILCFSIDNLLGTSNSFAARGQSHDFGSASVRSTETDKESTHTTWLSQAWVGAYYPSSFGSHHSYLAVCLSVWFLYGSLVGHCLWIRSFGW